MSLVVGKPKGGITKRELTTLPDSAFYHVNEKAWFNEQVMVGWIELASDDVDGGDGWSFGNMMHMMMMQNRMDNDQREQQNKADAEQREREYQLCQEEMAIAHKEAHEQRQFMNLLFMSMLNKNGGTDNSNPAPPSPSPGKNA